MSQPLRTRQRTRVRQDIQTAAWRLFATHGYGSVTTRQIADAAGVSESTYFRYVSSKDELLLFPLAASSAAIVAGFAEQPATAPIHAALAQTILSRTQASSDSELALWRSALASAPELRERVTLIRDDDRRELIRLATERSDETADPIEIGVAIYGVLAAAAFAYHRWFDGDSRDLATLIKIAMAAIV